MNIHKKYVIGSLVLCLVAAILTKTISTEKNSPTTAITYQFNGGRFGDNLLSYIACKYFSWKYKLPLLYRPFDFSDELQMHLLEKPINSINIPQTFQVTQKIDAYDASKKSSVPTLYVSNFYSKCPDWSNCIELFFYMTEHPSLHEDIKKMIVPIKKLSFSFPSDKISVAVHVRRGGGFDKPLLSGTNRSDISDKNAYADYCHPLKFPPDGFYIDHIRYLSEQLHNKPLYVYIFTDDNNPQAIVQKYQAALNKNNIIFDYHKKNEPFDNHTIQDLFFMKEFDCLIRPESALSIIAQIVGNHIMTIWPTKSHWEESTLIIDESACAQRVNNKLIRKTIHNPSTYIKRDEG